MTSPDSAAPAFALRMKSGHWVGIWNDRATAEHMRSRYRDGDKYEIVEFPLAPAAGPGVDREALLDMIEAAINTGYGDPSPQWCRQEAERRLPDFLALLAPERRKAEVERLSATDEAYRLWQAKHRATGDSNGQG